MKADVIFPKDEKAISIVRSYKEHFEMVRREDELDFYSSIHDKLCSEEPITHSDILFLIRVTSAKVRNSTLKENHLNSSISSLSSYAAEKCLEYQCEFAKDAIYLIGFLVAHSFALES